MVRISSYNSPNLTQARLVKYMERWIPSHKVSHPPDETVQDNANHGDGKCKVLQSETIG
jgi:hypothetical protein